MPLQGTERDRYREIIEQSGRVDFYYQLLALDIWGNIPQERLRSRDTANNYYGAGPFRFQSHVTAEDIGEIAFNLTRNARPVNEANRNIYATEHGNLKTHHLALPADVWYGGHCPGDPIFRIDDKIVFRVVSDEGRLYSTSRYRPKTKIPPLSSFISKASCRLVTANCTNDLRTRRFRNS